MIIQCSEPLLNSSVKSRVKRKEQLLLIRRSLYLLLRKIIVYAFNAEEFNNEDHHDSHEFLIWLLDHMNENIKSENKKIKRSDNESVIFY